MRKIGSMGSVMVALLASTAHAQAPVDAPNKATATEIGEIIVTAQRRSESLSKTPVAVSVLSADMLVKSQIVSEQDLRSATPGLTVKASNSGNQLNYAIRGQSLDPYSASRPGVLPYINEVQIGGVGGSSAFYDLQSVQVLKGPQGTLFGRSATGGAVLFTTATPTNELGGYISLLGGNYSAKKIEGALNVPIVNDTLMARVAGFWSERDGFQKNLFYGNRLGDYDRYGVRGSVRLKTGGLENNLVVDYYNTSGSNEVPAISAIVPNGFPVAALYAGVATPQDRATGIATNQAFLAGFGPAAVAAVPAFYDAYFAVPNRPGITQLLAEQNARGPFIVDANGLSVFKASNWIVTNKTTLAIGDDAELRNIIGYTHLKTFSAVDEGTPYGLADNNVPGGTGKAIDNLTKQFSEELQISGKAFDRRLTYVVGGYYSDESYNNTNDFITLDILLGGFHSAAHYELQNKTYAGYAQGTYALNDSGLSVTVGGRYTSEEVRKILLPDDSSRIALGDPAPTGYSYDKSKTFNKFSWTFGLQDQFDANTLVYVTTRRAFKSGGFNGTATPLNGSAAAGGDSVESEQVTDVELGLKYKSNSGGMPKYINIAAYHDWIKDRQTVAYFLLNGGSAVATVNVPSTKIYGFEIDGAIGPINGFTLGGTFNYTHARFGSELVAVPGPAFVQYDTYTDTPEESGSVYVEYARPVAGSIEASFRGELYAQSKVYNYVRTLYNEGSILPGYDLTNFRIGLSDNHAGWSLTANIKNAFNRVYYVGGIPFGGLLGFNNRLPGDPRTITVEARLKF